MILENTVRSQHEPNKWYNVLSTGSGLICDCPDHTFSHSDCKHIHVIKTRIMQGSFSKKFKMMKRDDFKVCKHYASGNIIKRGTRHNKCGIIQKYQCKDCEKRFVLNCGFESMRYDNTVITDAMQMYFTGMLVRDIADHYEMLGISVSHTAIYKWITKYSKNISEYLQRITPHLGTWFRADEVWVKVNGTQNIYSHQCVMILDFGLPKTWHIQNSNIMQIHFWN